MEDIKGNIAENLARLRKNNGYTQQEFAKIFNYSDKAVSRWEKGESLPDIDVLEKICDFYGIRFDDLIHKDLIIHETKTKFDGNKLALVLLYVFFTYTLATIIFVYNQIYGGFIFWQIFVWAIPVCCLFGYWYARKWWKTRYQIAFLSVGMWSLIISFYLQFLDMNLWPIFLLGIPLQGVIILINIINKYKNL